jgi:anti-sigma factor RsiW
VRCATVRDSLNAFVDAELPAELSEEMATHLQCCQSCRQLWTRLRQLGAIIQAAPASSLPDGFAGRVLSQARQRVTSPLPTRRASFPFLLRWQSVPLIQRAAAAAVLVIGLSSGVLMGWQTGSNQAATGRDAAPAFDDPVVVFNLDYLGGDPNGSLPQAYLMLVSDSHRPGE